MVTVGVDNMGSYCLGRILVTTWITVVTVASQAWAAEVVGSSTCSPSQPVCYTIYRNTTGLDWYQAHTSCRDLGLSLAAIRDRAAQTDLQTLGNSLTTDVTFWIAGARSLKNQGWTDIEGNPFTALSGAGDVEAVKCAAYDTVNERVIPVPCQAASDLLLVYCQRTPNSDTTCPTGMTLISNHCYAVPVNFTETWYLANQFCTLMYPESTLAYTGLTSTAVRDFVVTQHAGEQYADVPLWVGVNKDPWVWVSGAGFTDEELMVYSNWARRSGLTQQGHCTYIQTGDTSYSWLDRPCADSLQYYVCEEITTVPTTPTTTPTTPAPSTAGGGLSQTNIIIIICVVVAVVLIVIIVVTCIKCRAGPDKQARQETGAAQGTSVPYDDKRYSTDTYASMPSYLESPRDVQPLDIDPYQSASSMRIKSARDKDTGEGEDGNKNLPTYDNSGFMVDERL